MSETMLLSDQIAHAIHAELGLKGCARRSVAALYAVAIGAASHRGSEYWVPLNNAISARFGTAGLTSVKAAAWEIYEAAAQRLKDAAR